MHFSKTVMLTYGKLYVILFVVPTVELRRIQDVSLNGYLPHPMCVTFLTLSYLSADKSKLTVGKELHLLQVFSINF